MKPTRPLLAALAFAAFAAGPAPAETPRSFSQALEQCKTGETPEIRAAACAAAIELGELKGDALAAAFAALSLAFEESGAAAQAEAAINEAIRLNPEAGRYYVQRALIAVRADNCRKAMPDFDRAVVFGETSPRTYFLRGACYDAEGADRALVDFEAALHGDASFQPAWFGRAEALVMLGRKKDAVASADAGVAVAPDSPASYVSRAVIHLRLENTALAKADLAHALTLDAAYVPALVTLADLTYTDGNPEGALAYYTRALAAQPNDPEILNNRCYVAAEIGRLDEAMKDCEASIAIRANGVNLDSRGFIYLKRGDFPAAETDFDAALKHDAKIPSALYGRGLARIRLGRAAEGHADLDAANALDSEIAAFYEKNGLKP